MSAVATRRRQSRKPKAKPFTVRHFRDWAAELVLDNDEQWDVDDYFEKALRDVFAGFQVTWLVVPEENAKTTNVAGLCLYVMEFRPFASIPWAASSREQAEIGFRQAAGFVYRSDRLRNVFRCQEGYRRIRSLDGESRMQVFPADDRTGDGIIPVGLAILDELHRQRDMALYRTWLGKLGKTGAQLIAPSTAGEVGSEFEEERRQMRISASKTTRSGCYIRAERLLEGERLSVLHEYALPDGADIEDIALVKAANPSPRITAKRLRTKRALPGMTPQHWARFTCNLASRTSMAAITEAEWARAISDESMPKDEPIWAGLDVAWKWDTTALVPLWMRDPEFRLFGPATILEPPRDGSSLDPLLVEKALLDLHERNPLHTVVMDTSKAEQLASWVESELGARVIDRTQSNPMAALDYARFMEALRQGWLHHAGDTGLTQHALNAVARQLPGGDIRFDRPHESRRGSSAQHAARVIDALSAASMVHTSAAAELVEPEPVSWRVH